MLVSPRRAAEVLVLCSLSTVPTEKRRVVWANIYFLADVPPLPLFLLPPFLLPLIPPPLPHLLPSPNTAQTGQWLLEGTKPFPT